MSKIMRTTLAIVASSLVLTFNVHAEPAAINDTAQPQVSSAEITVVETGNFKDVGNVNSLLCKDIMGMVDDDKTIALSFMHGYVMGKKGVTQYVSGSLSQASDGFIEYCLEHPHDKALETFAKIVK